MAKGRRKIDILGVTNTFEGRKQAIILDILRQIIAMMDDESTRIAFLYAHRNLINGRFLPRDIRDSIERIARALNSKTYLLMKKGIRETFELNDTKNNVIEEGTQGLPTKKTKKKLPKIKGLYNTEKKLTTAVNEFVKRREQGLNISQRIWKMTNAWKKTQNDILQSGIKKGTSAKNLSGLLKDGVKEGATGRGVYKDPKKNAYRLARNEINHAYANADYERWQQIQTVVAIEVRLSNNHPTYDMCDELKGVYPKSFHFKRWHVNCLCVAIPKLATQEQRDAIMDYKLGLIDQPPKLDYVTQIPGDAKKWIRKNAGRVEGWKSQPYWWAANKDVVNDIKNPKKK